MEEHIVSYSKDQLSKLKGNTDWNRIKKMSDKDIEQAIKEDPDAPPILTEKDFDNLREVQLILSNGFSGIMVFRSGELQSSVNSYEIAKIALWESFIRSSNDGPKKKVTMNLDSDVVDHFKSKGKGYQSKINMILRGIMELEKSNR